MAGAHRAGLMLFPVVARGGHDGHRHRCVLVFEGVGVVRRASFILDRVWASALLGGAAATLFLA